MEQDKQQDDGSPSGKKSRAPGKVARIISLLAGAFLVTIFILLLATGYLSWIGCIVGALFSIPTLASPLAGFAGKKRLERRLSWVHPLMYAFMVAAGAVIVFWPEHAGTWHRYRFDDELADFERQRAVPDRENAAIRYDMILAAINGNDKPAAVFEEDGGVRNELWGRGWRSQDYPEASKWLDTKLNIIEGLMEIGQMQDCRWPIRVDANCEFAFPDKVLKYAVGLLYVSANRDLGEGRCQDSLAKYFCMFRIAGHQYQQTQHLHFYAGFDVERPALQKIRRVLVLNDLSSEDMDGIAGHLPTTASLWRQDLSRLLQFETLRFENQLAGVYQVNETGRVRFAPGFFVLSEDSPSELNRAERILRLYWPMNMPLDPHGVKSIAQKERTRFSHLMEQKAPFSFDKKSDEFRSSFDFMTKVFANVGRFAACEMCFSELIYTHFHERYLVQIAERRGTWLVLGLRKYKNEHGVWPESLDSISPYVPAEAFSDPITGEAFVYHREGESFRLYSKGPNRIDDGGRNQYIRESGVDEDDLSIWPPFVREPQPKRNRRESQQDSNDVSLAPSR